MDTAQTPLQTKTEADEATLGAGYGLLIFRLARASARHLSQSLDETGLRWPEFAVLAHLGGQRPIAQRDLALALRIQQSNLVALLDQLEERGLLRRSPDPVDGRRHRVELTGKGRRTVREAREATGRAESDLLAPLSATERREFRALLVRLTAHTCDRGAERRGARC
jgi:DNA-binding MarR family transcriptional regulator